MSIKVPTERSLKLTLPQRSLGELAHAVKTSWDHGVPDTATVDVDWNHYEGKYAVIVRWQERGR